MKQVVQVLGPTGIGKSHIALLLAKKFNGEIISADSMQVYKDFNIGSDKILSQDRQNIPHHLLDIITTCTQFNAAKFLKHSFNICESLVEEGKLPIVCGGTALYLHIMIRGLFPEIKPKKVSRERLKKSFSGKSTEELWENLANMDKKYAEKISKKDRVRIIRGLEIYQDSGIPPSEIFKKTETPFKSYKFIRIGLNTDRQTLYQQINGRVNRMIENGFVEEVKQLQSKYPPSCPPFKSVGYKEIVMYLRKEIDLETAIQLIKQHSRNLAKRQLTWFRKEKDIIWFTPAQSDAIMRHLEKELWKKA